MSPPDSGCLFAFLSLFGDNFGSAQLPLPTCLGQLRLGNKNILQIIATGETI